MPGLKVLTLRASLSPVYFQIYFRNTLLLKVLMKTSFGISSRTMLAYSIYLHLLSQLSNLPLLQFTERCAKRKERRYQLLIVNA